ncbi:MAG: sensor histidine kinase [Chloroflexaceae bacterium]|jgi:two-component system sensor histidine kinase DegS|nr:sensor histidine kinase [Chloroflexaceae bacterium]
MVDSQDRIKEVRDGFREEQERNRRELTEVEVLVRQGSSEVEKLAQRELSVSNRIRDLEVNLDKYSKEEIKNFYTAAQEVQMRLQMMRAQLEQLQLRQGALRSRQNQLSDLVELLDELSGMGISSPAQAAVVGGDSHDTIANIIQTQEKERLRISLQMHDGPAQAMSNLVLRAEICQRLVDRDLDQARSELTGLKNAINSTLQDTRKFIFELRPMTLDDLGLVPTLRRFIAQFGEKNNLEVNLMVQGLDNRLPNHYEVTIFRFIQEALRNIVKHANARQARVLLDVSSSVLQIVIEDEGSGFSISEVMADTSGRRNMGIASMRQQVEIILKGEFGLESAIGRGTRVAATIPLP